LLCEFDGLCTAFELRGSGFLRERDFFKPPRKFIFDDDRLSRISGRWDVLDGVLPWSQKIVVMVEESDIVERLSTNKIHVMCLLI
jgi:hypothetical protein